MISIRPVGVVRNKEKQHFGGWNKTVSDVVVSKRFGPALDGLEKYSHAVIVYWMHETKKKVIKHHPQGIAPLVGIFACRCQGRPNPIGVSAVKILKIRKNVLTVGGLDAVNNTPVLDIKPYTPQYDSVKSAKVPHWTRMLKY